MWNDTLQELNDEYQSFWIIQSELKNEKIKVHAPNQIAYSNEEKAKYFTDTMQKTEDDDHTKEVEETVQRRGDYNGIWKKC